MVKMNLHDQYYDRQLIDGWQLCSNRLCLWSVLFKSRYLYVLNISHFWWYNLSKIKTEYHRHWGIYEWIIIIINIKSVNDSNT